MKISSSLVVHHLSVQTAAVIWHFQACPLSARSMRKAMLGPHSALQLERLSADLRNQSTPRLTSVSHSCQFVLHAILLVLCGPSSSRASNPMGVTGARGSHDGAGAAAARQSHPPQRPGCAAGRAVAGVPCPAACCQCGLCGSAALLLPAAASQ